MAYSRQLLYLHPMESSYSLVERDIGGIPVLLCEELLGEGILVAFTGRRGGVSPEPYDSLNMALHVGDRPDNVVCNRGLLFEALRIDPEAAVCAEQVHGGEVATATEAHKGCGPEALPGVDAIVTKTKRLPVVILTADCVPIALVDPTNKVIGVVHAGWRGTLAGIAANAVEAMKELGSKPADMAAFIGPAIGPCCYEVDDDLAERFRLEIDERVAPDYRNIGRASQSTRRSALDLTAANSVLLEHAGMSKQRIISSGICTACNSTAFFSYRKDGGATGRQALIAIISEPAGGFFYSFTLVTSSSWC